MNISQENVQVFSWQRHGEMDIEKSAATVRKSVETGLFRKFLLGQDIIANKIVVDAGCGGGLKVNTYGLAGAKLAVGVDGSEKALNAAKQLTDHLGLTNVTYRRGFLEEIESLLDDLRGQVDLLVCNQVIHHCSNYQAIIRSFGRLLRPGGYLWINWLSLGLAWGHYILKNQITFYLGRNPEGRLKLGKTLFGWWDRRYNTQQIEENSFFADRYAAYYKIIFVGTMSRALSRAGFSIVAVDPPIDILELIRRRHVHREGLFRALERLAQSSPLVRSPLNGLLRTSQFVMSGGGGMRGFLCVKAPSQQS